VRRLTRDHGLRCVLYHEIAESPSEFTSNLNVTTTPDTLRSHLELLARDYEFVSLDRVLSGEVASSDGRPPVLVTFDDAYASVAGIGADICDRAGAPSVFFVNGAFVDNKSLAFDNLIAWIVSNIGMAPVTSVARREFTDLSEFFRSYLPSITLEQRERVYAELAEMLPRRPAEIASAASLYVTSAALASLRDKGMAVGNHTWSHVHCRLLDGESGENEVGRNRRFLESIVAYPVNAFSYPYGSRFDATDAVVSELVRSDHQAAFLVEAEANRVGVDPMRISRVSVGTVGTPDLFTDIEILPVLRRVRNRIR
jgi:peptidoglycan/xylan/chitin deacetylase (PgdA/CDA1 family)